MFCYCSVSDENFAPHYAAVLASVAEHGPKAPCFLVSDGIADETLARLKSFARSLSVTLEVIDGAGVEPLPDLAVAPHVSRATGLKIDAPALLPVAFSRALLLDCDLVAIGDIADLAAADMQGAVMSAVRDPLDTFGDRRSVLGLPPDATYSNTGVCLVDLVRWRDERVTQAVRAFAATYPEKISAGEQCALNAVLVGRIGPMDRKWNYLVNWDWEAPPEPDARILHFAGALKPWNTPFVPGAEFFRHYALKTPWGDPGVAASMPGSLARLRRSFARRGYARKPEAHAVELLRMKSIDDRSALLSAQYRGVLDPSVRSEIPVTSRYGTGR